MRPSFLYHLEYVKVHLYPIVLVTTLAFNLNCVCFLPCFLGSYFLDVLVPPFSLFLCRMSLGHHPRAKCGRSCPGGSPLPPTVTSALQSLAGDPVLQQYNSGLPVVMLLSRKASWPLALTDNFPCLAATSIKTSTYC